MFPGLEPISLSKNEKAFEFSSKTKHVVIFLCIHTNGLKLQESFDTHREMDGRGLKGMLHQGLKVKNLNHFSSL